MGKADQQESAAKGGEVGGRSTNIQETTRTTTRVGRQQRTGNVRDDVHEHSRRPAMLPDASAIAGTASDADRPTTQPGAIPIRAATARRTNKEAKQDAANAQSRVSQATAADSQPFRSTARRQKQHHNSSAEASSITDRIVQAGNSAIESQHRQQRRMAKMEEADSIYLDGAVLRDSAGSNGDATPGKEDDEDLLHVDDEPRKVDQTSLVPDLTKLHPSTSTEIMRDLKAMTANSKPTASVIQPSAFTKHDDALPSKRHTSRNAARLVQPPEQSTDEQISVVALNQTNPSMSATSINIDSDTATGTGTADHMSDHRVNNSTSQDLDQIQHSSAGSQSTGNPQESTSNSVSTGRLSQTPLVAVLAQSAEERDVVVQERVRQAYERRMEKELRERTARQAMYQSHDVEAVQGEVIVDGVNTTQLRRRRRRWIFLVVIILIVAAIATAVALTTIKSGSGGVSIQTTPPTVMKSAAPSISAVPSMAPSRSILPSSTPSMSAMPSVSPSNAPSRVPSVAPSNQPSNTPSISVAPTTLFNSVVDLIFPSLEAALGLHNRSIFDDPTTPQYRAIDWLSQHRGLANVAQRRLDEQQPPMQTDYGMVRLLEEYALIVLFYSTGGPTGWQLWYNFLVPSLTHCDWRTSDGGVVCDDDGLVTNLVLNGNSLQCDDEDCIPDELYLLTNLRVLDLYDNLWLRGTISTHIGRLTNLVEFSLQETDLHGPIPTEIAHLHELTLWETYKTQVSGMIPTEVGNMTKLETFDVVEAKMKGTLPSEIGNLANLEYLYLYLNGFDGPIPTEIGMLENLFILDFDHTSISGTMPSELGRALRLEELRLQNTNINGTIPTQYTNLIQLEIVDMMATYITGNLDPIFCVNALTVPSFFRTECADMTQPDPLPPVVCSCCSMCADSSPGPGSDFGTVLFARRSKRRTCYHGECTYCGRNRFVPTCADCNDPNVTALSTSGTQINMTKYTDEELCMQSCSWNASANVCETRTEFPTF